MKSEAPQQDDGSDLRTHKRPGTRTEQIHNICLYEVPNFYHDSSTKAMNVVETVEIWLAMFPQSLPGHTFMLHALRNPRCNPQDTAHPS